MPQIRIAPDGAALEIILPDEPPFAIHPMWLRERCADPANLDQQTEQRLYNPSDLEPDARILRIEPRAPEEFEITFSDGSRSRFSGPAILAELPDRLIDCPKPSPWSSISPKPDDIAWESCQTEAGRFAALEQYLVHGYLIVTSIPCRPGVVLEVARCFGFPRETNFGVLFDVRSVTRANDLAYTSLPLDPHTDNPYRAPVPGIQLLHCITNETPGGISTLVDGLAVNDALRSEYPDEYAILTTIPVRFRYVDAQAELVAAAPLIELDHYGEFAAIHYSPRLDFVPLLRPGRLAQFYTARRLLNRMLTSQIYERRFKLDDGHLMMFDNRRLLHGRTGFDPGAGLRHLQGCYIDADGPRSQYRILRRRLS
jgi:gamma-butyrobetaine dioxygenase